jgi:hypothetical protein
MARDISRGRYGDLLISFEGLERFNVDVERLGKRLPMAVRAALAGDGGDAIEYETKRRSPRGKTGELQRNIGKHAEAGGVVVGYRGAFANSHIAGARFQKGVWIESGVKPHKIKPKKEGGGLLLAGGRWVSEVDHPGFKGRKIMPKVLRSVEDEVVASVADEIDKLLTGGIGNG